MCRDQNCRRRYKPFPTVEVKDAVIKSDAVAIEVRADKKLRLCLQNLEDLVDKICAAALFDSRSANLHNDSLYVFAAFQGIVSLLVYQPSLPNTKHWYRLDQALCNLIRCDIISRTDTTTNSVLSRTREHRSVDRLYCLGRSARCFYQSHALGVIRLNRRGQALVCIGFFLGFKLLNRVLRIEKFKLPCLVPRIVIPRHFPFALSLLHVHFVGIGGAKRVLEGLLVPLVLHVLPPKGIEIRTIIFK